MNLKRIIKEYKKNGIWTTLYHQIKVFIFYKSKTIIFYELLLENSNFQKIEEKSDYSFVKLDHSNFNKEKFIGWEISEDEVLKRFNKKYILFAAAKNNILVCQNWSEPYKADIWGLKLNIKLPFNTIYTSRLYTIPEFRGKGIAKKTKLFMLRTLKEMEFKKAFLVIEESNKISQIVNLKFGFKPYQKVYFKRIFYFLRVLYVKEVNSQRIKRIIQISYKDKKIYNMFSKIK